jgi:hypothetical protein
MRFMPMAAAFTIALIGAVAVGLRPGYPFGALVLGATIVAAMTGLAASVLQFLPPRYFLPVSAVAGSALGLLVAPMLGMAQVLGFGDVRAPAALIWPVATVTALVLSRASGMLLPPLRHRRRRRHHPNAG